ncbi:MAG: nucleoside 2-deoxyribosyltransferase [Methanomicrobia archaeon]|nr:nucleoside 2-deoxyribosyltransferase [Methanomicrobia archaeon]
MIKPKRVFFSCSMRGGYSRVAQAELRKIPDIIEELGMEVISRHQTQADFIANESRLTEQQIHDRDYRWLQEADLVIAEITNPSLGVGAEIADAVQLGIPVLAIYRKEFENQISAYISGKTGVVCRAYADYGELRRRIGEFCSNIL